MDTQSLSKILSTCIGNETTNCKIFFSVRLLSLSLSCGKKKVEDCQVSDKKFKHKVQVQVFKSAGIFPVNCFCVLTPTRNFCQTKSFQFAHSWRTVLIKIGVFTLVPRRQNFAARGRMRQNFLSRAAKPFHVGPAARVLMCAVRGIDARGKSFAAGVNRTWYF